MKFNSPIAPDEVEALVRAHLEHCAARVDLSTSVDLLRQRLARQTAAGGGPLEPPQRTAASRTPRRAVRWALAVAASLLVAAGWAGYILVTPAPASAYTLVSEAQAELSRKLDRCYRVETVVPKQWRSRFPLLQSGEETLVWTRGDRFQVTTRRAGRTFTWGQDGSRRLWLVSDPDHGLRFDPGQAPPMLARPREYLGLDVWRLAHRFLEDFELEIHPTRHDDKSRQTTIHAVLKPEREATPFDAAVIELDAKTKTITRLELSKTAKGRTVAQFAFTLVERRPHASVVYDLESHLSSRAEILGAERAAERDEMLRALFTIGD